MIPFSYLMLQAMLASQVWFDPPHNPKEFICLAEAIYYEAGNQSLDGKVAVGNVIFNRTQHPAFPSDICDVIAQPKQFSYRDTARYRNRMIKASEYDVVFDSVVIAHSMLKYGIPDLTHGSKFYLNPHVSKNQAWTKNLNQTVKIEQHLFFKERK